MRGTSSPFTLFLTFVAGDSTPLVSHARRWAASGGHTPAVPLALPRGPVAGARENEPACLSPVPSARLVVAQRPRLPRAPPTETLPEPSPPLSRLACGPIAFDNRTRDDDRLHGGPEHGFAVARRPEVRGLRPPLERPPPGVRIRRGPPLHGADGARGKRVLLRGKWPNQRAGDQEASASPCALAPPPSESCGPGLTQLARPGGLFTGPARPI